jgi:hypothetical protein
MSCTVVATGLGLAGAVASAAPAAADARASYGSYVSYASYGLSVVGGANHRRPVPGETQVLRWTVTNTGTRAWSRVRLQVTVPARWRARRAAGCHAAGHRLSCELGRLAARAHRRATIRLVVPARPRYGTVHVRATTRAWSGRYAFVGPAASFPLTVVRAR